MGARLPRRAAARRFLADHVSWRWVFYINLPFGALAALAIAWGLSEPLASRRPVSVDVLGTSLFTVGISALLVGLGEGGWVAAWLTPAVVVPLAAAALCLVLFVVVERRVAQPLIPLVLGWVTLSIASARLVLAVLRHHLGAATSTISSAGASAAPWGWR